jgi:hypothetical protein
VTDLTDDWPDQPGNDDLARVGTELFADGPELPQIALDRIQVQMRQEMNRIGRRRRLRTILFMLVACGAIAVGLWAWQRGRTAHRTGVPTTQKAAPAAVRDTFDVPLPRSTPAAPPKPLIDLQGNGKLFGKEGGK